MQNGARQYVRCVKGLGTTDVLTNFKLMTNGQILFVTALTRNKSGKGTPMSYCLFFIGLNNVFVADINLLLRC
jgi:hypothetical protein